MFNTQQEHAGNGTESLNVREAARTCLHLGHWEQLAI